MIGKWWRRRQRAADRRFLFADIEANAGSQELAIMAKIMHAQSDPAWRNPDEYRGDEPEIAAAMDELDQ